MHGSAPALATQAAPPPPHAADADPPAGAYAEALRRLRDPTALAEVEAAMHRVSADGDDGPGDVLTAMAREHLESGGKRLRARLALAALEALGGSRCAGVGWAAACELLHNATLVHDDLQDGDRTRRGRPTVWSRHGAAQAINVGDFLLMLPFRAVEAIDAPAERRCALSAAVAHRAVELVRGQAAEIAMAGSAGWSRAAWRRAAERKTGALFHLPVEGAALLAGRDAEEADALGGAFRRLGVLFQLQDDVLDLFGDKGRDAPGSDLREGRVSALVVEHLALHPDDAPWLRRLLSLPRDATPPAEVERATERFRAGGALARTLGRIAAESRALAAAPALAGEPPLRALAVAVARRVLEPISHLGEMQGVAEEAPSTTATLEVVG